MKPLIPLLLLVPCFASAQDYTLVGAGVRSRPAYDGSESQRTDIIPVLRYYGRRWFARTTQGVLEGGARWNVGRGVDAGVQLAYEAGRQQDESPLLRALGIPDLDAGISLGAHIEWDGKLGPMPVNALGRFRQHLDTDRGAQLDARLTAGVYERGGFQAGVFTQATWASSKSNQSFYGTDGGLLSTEIGLLGSYDLARPWVGVGSVSFRQLRGDARRSAIVESNSNFYASVGLAYRF
jgi:outer membrane scaffolding protein for murein synthesis (MipA/OmpV family)